MIKSALRPPLMSFAEEKEETNRQQLCCDEIFIIHTSELILSIMDPLIYSTFTKLVTN